MTCFMRIFRIVYYCVLMVYLRDWGVYLLMMVGNWFSLLPFVGFELMLLD